MECDFLPLLIGLLSILVVFSLVWWLTKNIAAACMVTVPIPLFNLILIIIHDTKEYAIEQNMGQLLQSLPQIDISPFMPLWVSITLIVLLSAMPTIVLFDYH
jgi:uncharacterized membrane protein